MPVLWKKEYSRKELLRRVGDMRQLAAAEAAEWIDGPERGVRGVTLRNAAGLVLGVAADRGMALTHLSLRGTPLAFQVAGGAPHPALAEPAPTGWMRVFPAGFCTPCGLRQVGAPGVDGGEVLGVHGRLALLPASELRWGADWRGEDYVVWAEGTARETAFFGENLTFHRRVWLPLDRAEICVEDRVTNHGYREEPLMLLQHFNLGFPLVSAATRLELNAAATEARDARAAEGQANCLTFQEPEPAFAEQVYYHDLRADADGEVRARLVNPDFNGGEGLAVTWRYPKQDYPILVEWKCMLDGAYVIGVEPANCHVGGRAQERERGTLQTIAPQEERAFRMRITFD